jgi:hypothetical protein
MRLNEVFAMELQSDRARRISGHDIQLSLSWPVEEIGLCARVLSSKTGLSCNVENPHVVVFSGHARCDTE